MTGRASISGFLRENENEAKIQQVMAEQKVSIQVARNLLKAGKLGVGPAAAIAAGSSSGGGSGPRDFQEQLPDWEREEAATRGSREGQGRDWEHRGLPSAGPPPAMDKKAKARAMAEKLKKMQEEQDKRAEQEEKARQVNRKRSMSISMPRLGPVGAREEEVDPLKKKLEVSAARRKEREEREAELAEEAEALEEQTADSNKQPTQEDIKQMKARMQAEEERWKEVKRKRKLQEQFGGDSKKKGGGKEDDSDSEESGQGAGSSSGGLMTEAAIMKRMKKDRNKTQESGRGTQRAAQRIQKEMAEWEQAKAKNPEFWKPPKFCLVLGTDRR